MVAMVVLEPVYLGILKPKNVMSSVVSHQDPENGKYPIYPPVN